MAIDTLTAVRETLTFRKSVDYIIIHSMSVYCIAESSKPSHLVLSYAILWYPPDLLLDISHP